MSQFLCALLLLMPLCGVADAIYRTTDARGDAVFTDTPPPDGSVSEQIDIVPTNITPAPQAVFIPVPDTAATAEAEQREAPTYAVSISAPLDNTTIPLGPGNFSVTSTVSAALGANNSLQLFLDGVPEGEPQRATTWALTNVFPGQHDLTAAVIDGSGAILALSPAVRIFVLRTSSIRRNRNNK